MSERALLTPLRIVLVAAFVAASLAIPVSNTEAQTPPVIMLVGDSVPEQLQFVFENRAAARGWKSVSAALGACPVTGEVQTKADGTPIHVEKNCPGVVAKQDAMIQQHDPEVIVWWDRFDVHWFQIGGRLFTPGTKRFWRVRERRARAAIDRLSVDGARVVFVAVEPIGIGVNTECPPRCKVDWIRLKIDHYGDIFMPWNRLLRDIATSRPHRAGFVSVTKIVCHPIPVDRIPCNDKHDGIPLRPDGSHYGGPGGPYIVDGVLDLMTQFMPSA